MYLSRLIITRVSTETFTERLETKGQNWKELALMLENFSQAFVYLAHKWWQSPTLKHNGLELKRNHKDSNDYICTSQIGNVKIGHCLEPSADDNIYHKAVTNNCCNGGKNIKDHKGCCEAWWKMKEGLASVHKNTWIIHIMFTNHFTWKQLLKKLTHNLLLLTLTDIWHQYWTVALKDTRELESIVFTYIKIYLHMST